MKFEIYDAQFDRVIRSSYLTVGVDYDYALQNFVPLIDKLEFQRNPLRATFYKRLEDDILNGCIMPPITVAISAEKNLVFETSLFDKEYIENHLNKAFVLDGIQRLTTLKRISDKTNWNKGGMIYVNILICDSMDRLLYRMITLNNGQKPMTARHQIEILASNIFDFKSLPILAISEKQSKSKVIKNQEENMSKEVLIKGYLAFISNSINIDNQKIIESKMDELIAEQIMEANFSDRDIEYKDIVNFINNHLDSIILKDWFRIANNFIGFSSAMAKSFDKIRFENNEDLETSLQVFEAAFVSIDVSKIKLGLARRRMVKFFFEKYDDLSILSVNKLLDIISQEI